MTRKGTLMMEVIVLTVENDEGGKNSADSCKYITTVEGKVLVVVVVKGGDLVTKEGVVTL